MPNPQSGLQVENRISSETGLTGKPKLKQAARSLAQQHQDTVLGSFPPYIPERLSPQLELLQAVHQYFVQAAQEELTFSTAAEWILDNYYIVQQAARQVKQDLPAGYYQKLPKLTAGSDYEGYPRVFALARQYTLLEHCYTDIERVAVFLHAYQETTPLTMGELWALPTMLRFCLLECLAQTAGRITSQLTETSSPVAMLRFQVDASDTDTIANCILGLRHLDSQDWPVFFEDVSQVEQILRQDPAQIYGRMTFNTRDQYRKVVESLALNTGQSEMAVAQTAVQLAHSTFSAFAADGVKSAALKQPPDGHVGYYLLGAEREKLEQAAGYRPPLLRSWLGRNVTAVYLGSITLLTLLLLALLAGLVAVVGGSWQQMLLAVGLGFIPLTAVVTGLVNWLVTTLVKPRILPKLDFSEGLPAACRTLIVVPALLSRDSEIASLLSQLEQHFLRNPDPHLGFALLSDFADAEEAERPEDAALVQQATAGIHALNERYPNRPFYLFHRRRLYNPGEGVWMGWERKRGKLHELNRLLRGAEDSSFSVKEGNLSVLAEVKYVITLDADTVLPPDAACRLIGTLAHPLNQAYCDPQTGEVTAGYAILQPRTEIKPGSAGQSLFTRVFSGDTGLDLYSLAVSDVYQDLFGEGIYVGKGIYDVDAFECSLNGRVPENTLLSHDLFEGVQGRVGLVTDIVLYEDFPPHYLVHVHRSHRWVRGDWQLLPWLLPGHELSLLARWKIADNLRRSLVAPALFLFFVGGWLWLPGPAALWTLIGLLSTAVSLVTAVAIAVGRSIGGAPWRDIRRPIRDSAIRWLLQIAFLPFEALLNLDAVLITLWRLLVSRRNLLKWTTAAHTTRLLGDEVSAEKTAGQMVRALILVSIILLILVIWQPQALIGAAPLLLIWVLSTEIAYRISRPVERETAKLTPLEQQRLRSLARRTWLYFEEFVGPEDNWLPPDHFQETPRGLAAHRTSPTNTGLYLLSALAAYDLGYISLLNLSLRLTDTFDALDKLERYRGHFLNWIDTNTLHALLPRYVSTVDSGNLAGCLLALKQGCLAAKEQPVLRPQRWQGLLDTLSLFNEPLAALAPEESAEAAAIHEKLAHIQATIEESLAVPAQWVSLLEQLIKTDLPELDNWLLALFEAGTGRFSAETIHQWRLLAEQLWVNVHGIQRQIALFLPWLPAFQAPPAYFIADEVPPATQAAWEELQAALSLDPPLKELLPIYQRVTQALQQLSAALSSDDPPPPVAEAVRWCAELEAGVVTVRQTAELLLTGLDMLARRAEQYVTEMDFTFLYNPQRSVFHIGYNLESGRLDPNYYDLLASEARIASLVAIAKRDVPQKHWLHLARPMTRMNGGPALLSWSGTIFEYLMPPLLMNSYRSTLLAQSSRVIVDHQIAYGKKHNTPWGISESGFYAFDNAQNYQYRAFGVPGAGFKRGLSEDLVVAPYASVMALTSHPKAVMANLDHLLRFQMMGLYGLYEAIDFTPSRLPLGQDAAIIRSYMAHHQGMIMLALVNYLQDDVMVSRFHAEPIIQSVELLLQEQVPMDSPLQTPNEDEAVRAVPTASTGTAAQPWRVPVETPMPLVHYLSNGRLSSLISNAGSGYLTTTDFALTRWRPDTTRDNWGLWLYVQDMENGRMWSAASQPMGRHSQQQELHFFPHKAQFRRHDNGITMQTEITVAPKADAEIRLLHLTNDTSRSRRLRLTSYGEVVLNDFATDNRHQAFSKLFVESEYLPEYNALFFRRRPRSAEESPRFLGHMLVVPADLALSRAHESDRAQFLGRGRTAADPAVLQRSEKWLTGTTGATLDPIMALGQEVELKPHSDIELAWITFAADSREGLISLAQEFQRWINIRRAFTSARSQAEQELRRLKLSVSELAQIQRLLAMLIYPHQAKRAAAGILAANSRGQPSLWAYGISGDFPILLLRLEEEPPGNELLPVLLQAHTYWRRRGLRLDLVIVNQQETSYGQPVQNYLFRTVKRLESEHWLNKRGGIFILRGDQISQTEQILLETAARVVLDASAGSLEAQLANLLEQPPSLPPFLPTVSAAEIKESSIPIPRPENLLFDNGLGGFSPDGKEYLIYLEPGAATPAPWINVIANDRFGFLVSETGGGYSWAVNSGENRLTAWRNDPVSDVPAEALYLRDEETAEIWSPTSQPAPAETPYLVRHGAGYTIFEHNSHRLNQRLRLFAAPDAPVKIVQLRLENVSERPRRLTATYYAEWVLGTSRHTTQPYIIPGYRPDQHALLARNPYNTEFGEAVAFMAASKEPHGMTADRAEFLGRLGHLNSPAALGRIGLSNRTPVGADPCAAMQLHVDLPPGGSEEIYFLLGQGQDEAEALAVIEQFRDEANVSAAWEAVQTLWDEILGTITVETPEPAMNLLLNRWLLYQALACRVWGRSALYQSSGAYGFRDQLQDVMSLVHARPDLAREHLLRSARHQFESGDVLHWWHPPSGRGVRTRMTDDLVWLPFVTAFYVEATGDSAVLDETTPFLTAPLLSPDEEERYSHYETAETSLNLYEHCCRALEQAATIGRHGLPLMGAGDWNDGMNRVGIHGEGESVWLGWFLAASLKAFGEICRERGDDERADRFQQQAEDYREAIETEAWDGEWYRRAYYDDGTPLGSQQNKECRLDAIAQSWAVLTGLGERERAREAMSAVEKHLIKEEERLILLFTPPFDQTPKDPGYIKGYLPGIRENGGQYTHAALWTIWAFVELGQRDKAEALFRLINPILRADTPEKAARYKVEPYVIAADVYGVSPHEGRGGWTWYTGSSGWMYRLGIEGILGLSRQGERLRIRPQIPSSWPGFEAVYRYGRSHYHIMVENGNGDEVQVWLDGKELPTADIPLQDDGREHEVVIC